MISKFSNLVSCEKKMIEIFQLMKKISPTDVTVLILGESGTGKELVARAIHENSKRNSGPLITVNCAAIPENLIESELFGHIKGAFTGATESRKGKFLAANGGTLFLDEIGDMTYTTQAKILRALENRVIEPIGSNKKIEVDVRIIAATNKKLKEAIGEGKFREDLYYRLNEFPIVLPPLRERLADLHLIISQMIEEYNEEFSKEVKGISVSALGILQSHSWPGNIRELRNIMKRTMAIIERETIWVEHLPVYLKSADVEAIFDMENILSLKEMEKIYITRVLNFVKGNKSKAAKLLKIDRSTLYEKIAKYNIVI